MSGHSKWNNIKNRKGAQDAAKATVFTFIAKLIRVAVKESGIADPTSNAGLRLALDKARAANMPKDKIQRAIDAGLGKRDGKAIQEFLYEGYGPGGVALMIQGTTDNTQRTSAEMRFILSRGGGSLSGPGSAAFMFTKEGLNYRPTMPMEIADEAVMGQLVDLRDKLLEHDDVEEVFMTAVLPEENEE
jgi:YebC/PmpR family DNA-binding regulatory protein